ncbi:hypothetical protein CPB85DRAFT_1436179 [Mucidula mucida]|nr:hypothetical protein CPB85DRAFT_1436179 [Mucidula mucida]
MSSRASSPPFDDNNNFGDVFNAMLSFSPVHPTRNIGCDNDNNEDAERDAGENPANRSSSTTNDSAQPSNTPAFNPNLVQAVKRQPPFKVSNKLEKNINVYAVAILLSAKISSYKGAIVTKLLMDIIKKF